MNTERLHPVCEASGRSLQAFMNSAGKDTSGRAPCPICRKVVKLRKSGLDRWPNTIPHHHMPAIAAAAVADISLRNLEEAAPEMLAVLQWMFPEPGMQRNPTDEIYERALAAIAMATGRVLPAKGAA